MYHNFFIHSSVDEASLRRLQGQRRSTNKTVRGAKLCLESNPKPARDIERKKLRSSNKPCAHQDAETPQRLSQNCVWVSPLKVWVSSGLLQGQGLWIQQTWVWHKPFWGRSPLTPPESCQNLHRTGEQTLGGHKQNLVCTKTQEKRSAAIPARGLLRLARACRGVCSRGVGQRWPATGLGALSAAVCAWDLPEEVTIIFITSTTVWPQVK